MTCQELIHANHFVPLKVIAKKAGLTYNVVRLISEGASTGKKHKEKIRLALISIAFDILHHTSGINNK